MANDSSRRSTPKNTNDNDHDEPRRHDRIGMHRPEHRQVPQNVFADLFVHDGYPF